jgi:hypothetical protein
MDRNLVTTLSREETGNEALELFSRYAPRLDRFMRNFFTREA